MAKPPITISCESGKKRDVAYGERWQCKKCGRSWNTTQIPVEEYELLLRRVRRHKLEALGLAGGAAAVLVPLIIFVSATFIGLVPLAMMGWLLVCLPGGCRRYRRTVRIGPRV